MKRKTKIYVIITIIIVIGVLFFILVVNKISESHKRTHGYIESRSLENYIEDYGTGERKQFSYFAKNSNMENEADIEYLIIELKVNDKGYQTRYYFKEEDIISQVVKLYEESSYIVSKMDFREKTKEGMYGEEYEVTFVSRDNKALVSTGYETEADDADIQVFHMVEKDNLHFIIEGQEDAKYRYYGLFTDKKVFQGLQNLIQNEVSEITMEQIDRILQENKIPEIQDFYCYRHTKIYEDTSLTAPLEDLYEENRLELAGEEGYLLITNSYWMDESSMGRDIQKISLYSADNQLQKVLYERQR